MTRRPINPREAAEAAFRKPAKTAPALPKTSAPPGAREQVTLRIDSDVLELFQADGPGWQDRINAALRESVRARLSVAGGGGMLRVDELNSENDDGAG